MIRLKAGQKVFLEDGSRAVIEKGDCLEEASISGNDDLLGNISMLESFVKIFDKTRDGVMNSFFDLRSIITDNQKKIDSDVYKRILDSLRKLEKFLGV